MKDSRCTDPMSHSYHDLVSSENIVYLGPPRYILIREKILTADFLLYSGFLWKSLLSNSSFALNLADVFGYYDMELRSKFSSRRDV